MTQHKTTVAVIFGGQSGEHPISCLTATSVLAHLNRDRFEVVPIAINRQGNWIVGVDSAQPFQPRNRELPTVDDLVAAPGKTLTVTPPTEALRGIDVVFPLLHGAWGEDGTIQGLLELEDIRYVGSGVLASALCMDKEFTKRTLRADGIAVGEFAILRPEQETLSEQERARLSLPVFVKPARAGSSLGVSKVTSWSELDEAIAFARKTDHKVIIESGVVGGRELECGVLEFPDGRIAASLPGELRVIGGATDWYDFDAKYIASDDVCEFDIPAKLDPEITEQLRKLAISAFKSLDCQGIARVDFFLTAEQELIINEINTMPGFTPISLYPRVWDQAGITYPTLVETLIDSALARRRANLN